MTTEIERLARVEALLEEVRDHLRRMDTRIDRLEARIDRLEARQEAQFRWVMSAVLGVWVTIVAIVLGALLTR
ncbi:MAG: hypothetical protein ACK4K2_01775 [Dehalococcoidia bacterium]